MHEAEEKLYFSTISEDRGEYFVEYSPPKPGYHFAFVALTFMQESALEHVARCMEREAREWLARYPIAVFVSAFDAADNAIDLGLVRSKSDLIAYVEDGGNEPSMHWERLAAR